MNRYKDTLLIVGDQSSDRVSLRQTFESKYFLLEAENCAQGIMLLKQSHAYIAAVLIDVPLSQSEDIKALARACKISESNTIPLISIITPSGTGENEEYAFVLGATDVILKPYTTLSVIRRVQVLADLQVHQHNLERLVEEQSHTILKNSQIMIDTLSSVIEYRSAESGHHVLRIRRFTKLLLEELAKSHPEYKLTKESIETIVAASALHDIGKISIPDSILNKPGRLTDEEQEIMKTHTTMGWQLLSNIKLITDTDLVKYIYNIVLCHHERYDGSGYPEGLKGDSIPICAQAVGLADAYDALRTQRVYKPAYSHDRAVNMIINGECGMFAPKLIECFKRVHPQFDEQAKLYADGLSLHSEDVELSLPMPEKQTGALNSLQVSQYKYQTLLHHMGDTVIEMNLTGRMFHVVSNPNPDFASLFNNVTYETLPDRLISETVLPDEVEYVGEQHGTGMAHLFVQGNRSYSFDCHMYSPFNDDYVLYNVTFQKILTEDPSMQAMLMILHKADSEQRPAEKAQSSLLTNPAIRDLSSALLCCVADDRLTIREGASSLAALTGYHVDDIWNLYDNSLVSLTLPDDREALITSLSNQDIRSGKVELQFKLYSKNGDYVWALCRSRAAVGDGSMDFRYLTLTDITDVKANYESMEIALNRHRTLTNLSNNILFDWNVKTNDFFISEKWEERFGRKLDDKQSSGRILNTNFIHPDDLETVRNRFIGINSSSPTEPLDLRALNSEGQYLWSRVRYAITRDKDNNPDHIIGIIYDIDQLKTEAISMRQQAKQDGLTSLLNSASIRREVKDYLSVRKESALGAMLILDVDNFKAINDTLGHFYGDAVLKQMGQDLKSLFRSQDAIGRSGGDEFIILLKDIPDKSIVTERCKLLVEHFRELFARLTPNLPVSVSIGASVAPENGVTYADLYRLADEALYQAKRKGKNGFVVYNSKEKFSYISAPDSHVTRIDSDFRASLDDESMMEFIFNLLYDTRDFDTTVNEILAFVGIQFNVSRVYIFENNGDNTACSNTFEWCNEGIDPQIEFLQDLRYAEDLPGFREAYNEEGILYSTDINELTPEVRAVLEPQGVKSMLHCSIMDDGISRGFVGFDECTANHLWTQGQVSMLKLISKVLSVFITKHRQKEKAQ